MDAAFFLLRVCKLGMFSFFLSFSFFFFVFMISSDDVLSRFYFLFFYHMINECVLLLN